MTDAGRRRTFAVILSGVFPGLGQLYNRQPAKGVLFLVIAGALSGWLIRVVPGDPVALVERGMSSTVLFPALALLIVSLWSVVDAWHAAVR